MAGVVEVGDFDELHARIAKTVDATTIRYTVFFIVCPVCSVYLGGPSKTATTDASIESSGEPSAKGRRLLRRQDYTLSRHRRTGYREVSEIARLITSTVPANSIVSNTKLIPTSCCEAPEAMAHCGA